MAAPRDHTKESRAATRRKHQLTLIHIARAQLGMEEDVYRDRCRKITSGRSASSGHMTNAERGQLLDMFRRLGWQPRAARPVGRRPRNVGIADLRSKLEAQLSDLGLSWTYAESILRRMRGLPATVGCTLEQANWRELQSVISALHVEQEKRQLIAAIDAWLIDRGSDRAWFAFDRKLKKGWDRDRGILRSLYLRIFGVDFVIDRGP